MQLHTLVALDALLVDVDFAILLFEDRPGILENALFAMFTLGGGALPTFQRIPLVAL